MTKTMVLGLLLATLIFWAVGAYNRLVRLRSEVVKAFSQLDNALAVQPALIKATWPPGPDGLSASDGGAQPPTEAPWLRLLAAGEQFAHALANVRARPLDPRAIDALSSAHAALRDVWLDPVAFADLDPVTASGDDLPQTLRIRLMALDQQARVPAMALDAAVQSYNRAIRQFPASILASVWGFRAAAAPRWPSASD